MESRKIKILAIDDNQDNLTSIKALIKDAFSEAVTLTALNGTKGFELAAAEDPDVILLDIVMPGMDGFEVCKKLKADKMLCDIPVVFVTAIKGDKENRIRALEAGAEAFLAKPVELTELTAQVRAMVKIKNSNLAKANEKERLTALVEEKTLELKKTYAATLKLLEELNTENEIRKKSEQKYQLLFQNLTTGFALHEIIVNEAGQPCDYRFLEINPAFETLTGLKAIDLIGRTNMEVLPGAEIYWAETYGKVALTGESIHFEHYNEVSGKHYEVMAYSPQPGKFATLILDVSERKLAEQAIQISEKKFRSITEQTGDLIAITDTEGLLTYASPASKELFFCTPEEMCGRNFVEFLDEPDVPKAIAMFRMAIENGETTKDLELMMKRKDGSLFIGELTGSIFQSGSQKGTMVVIRNISERRQNEQRINDLNERLSLSLETANAGTWDWDIQNNTIFWPEEFLKIFGMKPDTVPGFEAWTKSLHPEDVEIASKNIQVAIDEKTDLLQDYRIILPGGEQRWIRATGKVTYQNDVPIRMVGLCMDITGQKRADEALQESENKFKAIFENNSAAMAIIEPDTTISMVNEAYCQISGYTPQEIVGMSWINQIPPDDLDRLKEYNQRRLSNPNDAPDKYEFTFLHKNGAIKHALMSVAMIQSNKKIITSFVDITERKRAEEVLKNEQALTNAIIESIPGTFYMLDEIGQYVRWNAYQRDEIVGKPDELVGITNALDTIHPDDRVLLQSKIVNVLSNGVDETIEGRVLLRGGPAFRWFLMTGRRMLIDDRPFLVGIGIDITESKSAENKIRLLNETLELRVSERTSQLALINKELAFHLSELEQFSYVSNHDLREPLRTLTQCTKLFNEKYAGKLDEEGEKYIEFISKSAIRMTALVKDLLDYSILGKESVKTIVDCNKIVDVVLSDLDDSITGSHSKISFQNLPIVHGYETEIRLLFQNLIENAIKYQKKDIIPEINILAESHEKEWLFSIMDNGIGIDQKHFEKIFNIFQRLHNRNEFEGTGIGLAQCKKIVELHGGKIWVESTPGAGSTFMFTIPKR